MKKTINLVTAIIDFCMAVILMMIAVSGRSVLTLAFAVVFVGMGVYFLRYFEREVERLNREKEEKEGFVKKSEH